MPCKEKGRCQDDAAKSKECQRLPETTRCLERSMEHVRPSQPLEEKHLPQHLDLLVFQPPELWDKLPLLKPLSSWYFLPQSKETNTDLIWRYLSFVFSSFNMICLDFIFFVFFFLFFFVCKLFKIFCEFWNSHSFKTMLWMLFWFSEVFPQCIY